MASAPSHLWHYLLNPTQAMTVADAARLRPAMARLAMLSSPATAAWLLAPVLPPGDEVIPSADVLRDRLGELDRERPIIAYCQVGMRGYLATRILLQHGFKVRNLSGGYTTYKQVMAAQGG